MVVTQNNIGCGGRIGNTLFAIAATIGIAKENGMSYTFPRWKYQDAFVNKLPAFEVETEVTIPERAYCYNEYQLEKTKITNLFGYFQSEKYWINYKDEVLEYFTFTNEVKASTHEKNPFTPFNNVAIHVRRGDYLTLPDYHPVLPMSYYEQAISLFDNKRFIVFSDDKAWCRENFKGDKFLFANGNEVEDLYLMSMCESHIIANSSFSWWGNYLSGSKIVIAPSKDKWFGAKLKSHNVDDLYMNHWKLI
jgi:hypothetical protein